MATPTNSPFGKPADESFEVDFDGVGEKTWRIPEADYGATLASVEKKESKAGNPMLVFEFVLNHGGYAGRKFKVFCALTPAAMWKAVEVLKAFGLEPDPNGKTKLVKFKATDVVGKQVLLEIVDDDYDNEERSTVGKVKAHPEGTTPTKGVSSKSSPRGK